MAWFTFTLQPMDKFLFGGEKSEYKTDYYFRSNLFPQQTAVLGMLRFEILKRSPQLLQYLKGQGQTVSDWPKAKRLIGDASFNASQQTFGVIQQLSPFQVGKGSEVLLLRRKASEKAFQNLPGLEISYGHQRTQKGGAFLDGFNAKKDGHDPEEFNGSSSTSIAVRATWDEKKRRFDKDGIFMPETHPGITKAWGEQPTKNEAYYKFEYLRLAPGYHFTFYAEIDNSDDYFDEKGDNSFVTLGAEKSPFKMRVEKSDVPYSDDINGSNGSKILLLSDALVDNSIYNHCRLAIADSINFRNLNTKTQQGETFTKKPVGKNSNGPFTLMKRGSVLYPNDWQSVKTALKKDNWRTIGYNHFKIEP